MTDQPRPPATARSPPTLRRRRLLTLGAGAGVALLAGCSGSSGGDGGGGGYGGGGGGTTGTFRLLISDQPVAIDEFDSLDVTLLRARIFPAGGEDEDDDADGAQEGDDEEGDDDGEDDAGDRGFETLDLGGATVDLTEVVGEKAISVFEGGLPAGEYAKVELETSAVEGVVDGEAVDVKLPSEKLQITKPFTVAAGGTLSFVFDITVVRKGNGGYNLLPVVGESGVVGRDVDVEEVGPGGDDDDGEDDEDDDTGTDSPESPGGGPPDGADGPPTETGG